MRHTNSQLHVFLEIVWNCRSIFFPSTCSCQGISCLYRLPSISLGFKFGGFIKYILNLQLTFTQLFSIVTINAGFLINTSRHNYSLHLSNLFGMYKGLLFSKIFSSHLLRQRTSSYDTFQNDGSDNPSLTGQLGFISGCYSVI